METLRKNQENKDFDFSLATLRYLKISTISEAEELSLDIKNYLDTHTNNLDSQEKNKLTTLNASTKILADVMNESAGQSDSVYNSKLVETYLDLKNRDMPEPAKLLTLKLRC